jgi:hypothetical protein
MAKPSARANPALCHIFFDSAPPNSQSSGWLSAFSLDLGREDLVLVPLVCRRCYCSSSALFLFFSGCRRQGGVIQHFAVAGDPGRFGSRSCRQYLVALDRAARCCTCFAPGVSDSRSAVHVALSSALSSPPEFSLTRTIEVNRPYLRGVPALSRNFSAGDNAPIADRLVGEARLATCRSFPTPRAIARRVLPRRDGFLRHE